MRGEPTRLVIAGMPRSGTTLLATFLAAQRELTFVTDYLRAFSEAADQLGVGWRDELSSPQRRVALAMVRDETLRMRHLTLVKPDQFRSVDDLHRLVMAELAKPGVDVVGHKMTLRPTQVRSLVESTDIRCVVMIRDPRDAALSYWHRTGGGVEAYLEEWKEMVRLLRRLEAHPGIVALRFEQLVVSPAIALGPLQATLGVEFDFGVPSLAFRRGSKQEVAWTENSAFQDVRAPFDPAALSRWRANLDSEVVRYAAWVCASEIVRLGYEPSPRELLRARESARFRAQRWATLASVAITDAGRRASRRLRSGLVRPISHRTTRS